MRALVVIVVCLLAGIAAVAAVFRVDRPLRIAAAVVAHDICSQTFVSGLDPQQIFDDSLAPREGLSRIARHIRFNVDRSQHEVSARVLLLFRARAVFYPGLGCIVLHGNAPQGLPTPQQLMAAHADVSPVLPEIAGAHVVTPDSPPLIAALDHAFDEPAGGPHRRTHAVVVVHNGRVIAERYAAGVGIDTPMLGFSMTKSMINALVGILVMQGQLTLNAPAPVAAWTVRENDARRSITLEQLMRMTSGLDLDEEDVGPANPSDRMLYLSRDMSRFAEDSAEIATPGSRFAYSSASTHIVAELVRQAAGGRAIDCLEPRGPGAACPVGDAACHRRGGRDRDHDRFALHVRQRPGLGPARPAVCK